jgi:hypothetical protein
MGGASSGVVGATNFDNARNPADVVVDCRRKTASFRQMRDLFGLASTNFDVPAPAQSKKPVEIGNDFAAGIESVFATIKGKIGIVLGNLDLQAGNCP